MKHFILFFILIVSVKAMAIDPPPPFAVSSSLTAQGHTTTIPTGSYLRMVNFNKNFGSWYHQALIVDSNNNVLNPNPLKISQSYMIPQMSHTINNDLQFIDSLTGSTVTGYSGQQYVITGANNSGWKTYDVHFVDNEGNQVDHKGIPVSTPREYKVSQKYVDQDRGLRTLRNVEQMIDTAGSAGNAPCVKCEEGVASGRTQRPVARPETLVADLGKSSFSHLKGMRSELRSLGYQGCMNKKDKIQKEYLSKHEYGKLTVPQRANKILSDARNVYDEMRKASGSNNKASSSRYKSFVNGHFIDPVVTPEVTACIAYQETKGNLNPYAVNYTLCNKNMTSSAHGLGQMTKSSLSGLRNNPDGDLLPLNTPHSKKYAGMSTTDIHAKMSGDVGMQLEVLMRLLSSNAKFIRWKNPNLSANEVLKRAIVQYDRDAQSKYIRNVYTNCLPCLVAGGSGSSCYSKVE